MSNHDQNRATELLALREFPRSLGMITAAIILVITLDPLAAISYGLSVWLVAFLIKSVLIKPDFVDTYLWSCLSTIILAIGAWPIRWLIYLGLVIFALFKGASFSSTALYMGGLLVYDLIIVFSRGS